MERIRSFLSSRIASALILCLSLAGRVLQVIHFSETDGDRAYQIQATFNLLHGHGLTLNQVFADNLANSYYVPMVQWPPGYSLLLTPFYVLCNSNFLWATICLDLVAAILLMVFARKILRLLQLPVYLINLYTLVSGFFMYQFILFITSDLITLSFFVISIYLTLSFILSENKSFFPVFFIAFFLFVCGLIRYMFIPIAFIIPLYLIFSGMSNRNKMFLKKGIQILLLLVFFIGGLLIFQKIYAGSATYIMNTEKGIYPGNLLRMHPFLFSSLANLNMVCVQLEKITGIFFSTLSSYLRLIHFLPFLLLIIIFIQWVLRKKLRAINLAEQYIYIGGFSSLAIIGLLMVLSFSNSSVDFSKLINWSFVQESRYFAFVEFFIQQLLFITIYYYRFVLKRWMNHLLKAFFIILLLSTMHDIYYTVKIGLAPKSGFYYKRNNAGMHEYYKYLLEMTLKNYPEKEIVVVSDYRSFCNYAAVWYNIPSLYDYTKINPLRVRTQKEAILFIILRREFLSSFQQFLKNQQKSQIGQFQDYYFFTMEVNP